MSFPLPSSGPAVAPPAPATPSPPGSGLPGGSNNIVLFSRPKPDFPKIPLPANPGGLIRPIKWALLPASFVPNPLVSVPARVLGPVLTLCELGLICHWPNPAPPRGQQQTNYLVDIEYEWHRYRYLGGNWPVGYWGKRPPTIETFSGLRAVGPVDGVVGSELGTAKPYTNADVVYTEGQITAYKYIRIISKGKEQAGGYGGSDYDLLKPRIINLKRADGKPDIYRFPNSPPPKPELFAPPVAPPQPATPPQTEPLPPGIHPGPTPDQPLIVPVIPDPQPEPEAPPQPDPQPETPRQPTPPPPQPQPEPNPTPQPDPDIPPDETPDAPPQPEPEPIPVPEETPQPVPPPLPEPIPVPVPTHTPEPGTNPNPDDDSPLPEPTPGIDPAPDPFKPPIPPPSTPPKPGTPTVPPVTPGIPLTPGTPVITPPVVTPPSAPPVITPPATPPSAPPVVTPPATPPSAPPVVTPPATPPVAPPVITPPVTVPPVVPPAIPGIPGIPITPGIPPTPTNCDDPCLEAIIDVLNPYLAGPDSGGAGSVLEMEEITLVYGVCEDSPNGLPGTQLPALPSLPLPIPPQLPISCENPCLSELLGFLRSLWPSQQQEDFISKADLELISIPYVECIMAEDNSHKPAVQLVSFLVPKGSVPPAILQKFQESAALAVKGCMSDEIMGEVVSDDCTPDRELTPAEEATLKSLQALAKGGGVLTAAQKKQLDELSSISNAAKYKYQGFGFKGISSQITSTNAQIEDAKLLMCKLVENQKFECPDPIAAVPEWWQVRKEGKRPQLVVLFCEQKAGKTVRGAAWSLTIPHYTGNRKPRIPSYRKGNWEGILTLADNSKIIVNAYSKSEAERVIKALSTYVKRAYLIGSFAKYGERKGQPLKTITVSPTSAKYFPEGLQNLSPAWTHEF